MLLYYQGVMAEKNGKRKMPSEEKQLHESRELALSGHKAPKTFGIPSRHSIGQMLVKYNMSEVSSHKNNP